LKKKGLRGAAGTKEALKATAARIFAERGFEGARVDDIARHAGVNKAMINYHFGGKRKLYVAILTATLTDVASRLGALLESSEPPETLLRRFISTFVEVMQRHPTVPAMLVREMLSGGRHVDQHLLPHFLAVFSVVREIIARGVADGSFRPVHPALAHFSLIGSLLFFFVTAGVRDRLQREGKLPLDVPPPEGFARHVQDLMVRGLAAD
jgi:AcrR family transcriptional regulator